MVEGSRSTLWPFPSFVKWSSAVELSEVSVLHRWFLLAFLVDCMVCLYVHSHLHQIRLASNGRYHIRRQFSPVSSTKWIMWTVFMFSHSVAISSWECPDTAHHPPSPSPSPSQIFQRSMLPLWSDYFVSEQVKRRYTIMERIQKFCLKLK